MLFKLFSLPLIFLTKYGYFGLFFWSILEGEMGLMLTGYLISQGEVFTLHSAFLVAISGAFIGDNTIFLIGRVFEARAKEYLSHTSLKQERIKKWLERWGIGVILFERFAYGTHIPTLLTLGISGYSYIKFLLFDILGISLWAISFLLIGYYFGQEAIHLILFIQKNILLALIIIGVISALVLIKRKKDRLKKEK